MAKGDLGFATALMILLQLCTILLVPILLPLSPWNLGEVAVDGLAVLQTLALSMFLPILAGMLIRQYWRKLAERLTPWMGRLSTVALLVLTVLGVGMNHSALRGLVGSHAFDAALMLIAGGWVIGWLTSSPPNNKRVVSALIASSQNNTAALLIVAQEIEAPMVLLMVLAFDVVMTLVNAGAAHLAGRHLVDGRK
jgi:BASS family bile acid:Na+ symporter